MASNPPFMVEDTDEDFFDKLVDDDDDDDLNPPALALKEEISTIVDDNDSDDAKAFANLSISDVGAGVEDLGEVGLEEEDVKDSLSITKEEFANVTRVDSNSLTVDNNNVNDEPDNGTIQLGSTASEDQNQGSGGTAGVKEVQWSSFGSDSVENSDNVFGADPGFFNEFDNGSVDQIGKEDSFISSVVNNSLQVEDVNTYSSQLQSDQAYATTGEQATDGQDPNSIQYWENLYPGWKYDAITGQWYQVDGNYDATSYAEGVRNTESASDWNLNYQNSEVSYLQQSAQSVVGAVAEKGTTESITSWDSVSQSGQSLSNWNQGSEDNIKVYPPHMFFDPQYPGWYYDMHVQEWRSLDDYNSQSTAVAPELINQNGYGSSNTYYENEQKTYSGQEQAYNWNGSFSSAGQQSSTMWQHSNVATSAPMEEFRKDQQIVNHYGSNFHVDNNVNQENFYDYAGTTTTQVDNGFPAVSGSQSTVPYSQPFSQPLEQSESMNVQKAYGNQNQLSYLQQTVQSAHQVSYGSTTGRSSAGRPPHALATFGFGGKLIVMKDDSASIKASYGGQDSKSGSISVLNLAEVVTGGGNVHDYFHNLCQQPYPGPLSGGNAGSKELNKWIDDTITHTETSDVVYNKGGVLRLLLSLLKIALQHYGKLRSPLGSDTSLKENDAPEVAVARLFASVKSSAEYHNYGAFSHCLQHVPSEAQTREAAAEVQTLLVSGRKK